MTLYNTHHPGMRPQRTAILAAMKDELLGIENYITNNKLLQDRDISFHEIGIGVVNAGPNTREILCTDKSIDSVLLVGSCGALSESLKPNDIGLIDASILADVDFSGFDETKKRGESVFSKERVYKSDRLWRLSTEQIAHEYGIDPFIGYMATQSKFLDKERKIEFIEQVLPLLVTEIYRLEITPNTVDMETAIVHKECALKRTPCLAIKYITDGVNSDAVVDFKKYVKNETNVYQRIVELALTKGLYSKPKIKSKV